MKIKWNEEKEEYEELEKGTSKGWYIEPVLKENLDNIKQIIKKDWDYVFTIDGEEGSGKSVFAMQLAAYCSNNSLSVDDICIEARDFKERVREADQYDAIVFDEAFRGLGSRNAMSKTNKTIVSMLQEIRQKNLFIFIVLPSVWDLDKYVVLHRTNGLFHVYTGKNKQRGFFKYFNRNHLKYMVKNYSRMKYDYPDSSAFAGRFTDYYPIDEEEYREKKRDALESDLEEEKTAREIKKEVLMKARKRLGKMCECLDKEEMAKVVGRGPSAVRKWDLDSVEVDV